MISLGSRRWIARYAKAKTLIDGPLPVFETLMIELASSLRGTSVENLIWLPLATPVLLYFRPSSIRKRGCCRQFASVYSGTLRSNGCGISFRLRFFLLKSALLHCEIESMGFQMEFPGFLKTFDSTGERFCLVEALVT